jgi:hypothetical protein
VERADVVCIMAEHGRFEARGADQMVGHDEARAPLSPGIMLGDDWCELGNGASVGIPLL